VWAAETDAAETQRIAAIAIMATARSVRGVPGTARSISSDDITSKT
jgi:hypothetical protein